MNAGVPRAWVYEFFCLCFYNQSIRRSTGDPRHFRRLGGPLQLGPLFFSLRLFILAISLYWAVYARAIVVSCATNSISQYGWSRGLTSGATCRVSTAGYLVGIGRNLSKTGHFSGYVLNDSSKRSWVGRAVRLRTGVRARRWVGESKEQENTKFKLERAHTLGECCMLDTSLLAFRCPSLDQQSQESLLSMYGCKEKTAWLLLLLTRHVTCRSPSQLSSRSIPSAWYLGYLVHRRVYSSIHSECNYESALICYQMIWRLVASVPDWYRCGAAP